MEGGEVLVCGEGKEQSPSWTWRVGRILKEEGRKKGEAEQLRGLHHPGGQSSCSTGRIPGFVDHPVKVFFTKLLFLTLPTFMGTQTVQSTP